MKNINHRCNMFQFVMNLLKKIIINIINGNFICITPSPEAQKCNLKCFEDSQWRFKNVTFDW